MMDSQNTLADNKEQTSGALVTLEIVLKFFAVLYFPSLLVGRWYKQWYYAAFGISFEQLELTQLEYIWSSWTSWLSGLSLIFIVWNLYASFRRKGIAGKIVALTVVFTALILVAFWPFHFDPQANLLIKVLGSKDVLWWALGFVALISLDRIRHHRDTFVEIKKNNIIDELIDRGKPLLSDFSSFASLLLVTIGILVVMGYCQATYQAHAAINEGKMGLSNTVYQGKEWHKLNIGPRVYLYDPASKTTIQYKDDKTALPSQPFKKLQ